jgi:hypothetical protein
MAESHSGGAGVLTLVAFAVCAGVTALVADLLQPLGPVALVLALAFLLLAIISGVLSLVPPTRALFGGVLTFAIVGVAACGGVFALQRFVAPQADGVQHGVFSTLLPPLRALQDVLITEAPKWDGRPPAPVVVETVAPPPSPAEIVLGALSTALASPDPAERLRGGIAALGERDPAVLAAVVDKLYRSSDPAVRQLAVKRLLAQRRGARIPIMATAASPDAQPFANALQTMTIRSLNETSGAFEGSLCAPGMAGAVNRSGVTISARCKIGAEERAIIIALAPTDSYLLVGEARNDAGQTARVELPLM